MVNLREHLTSLIGTDCCGECPEGKDLYMKGICIQGGVRNANSVCIRK